MAIKIIRHGVKKTVECPNCTCLFEYEKEDVSTIKTGHNEYDYYVLCPDCLNKVDVPYFNN